MKPAKVTRYTTPELAMYTGEFEYDYFKGDPKGLPAHYLVRICVKAVSHGPRGGVIPGEVVEIRSETWRAAREAVRELGYPAPPMSLVSLKHDW